MTTSEEPGESRRRSRSARRERRSRRGAGDPGAGGGCDTGDSCNNCDSPGCDSLDCPMVLSVSGLIMLASVAARVGGRIPVPGRRRPAGTGVAVTAILAYRRWLSHRLPTRCRYVPTCSAFGLEAIQRYGLETGGRLAAERIRGCRAPVPFGTADPVEAHATS